MGFFSDVFKFEKFNTKGILDKIKDKPQRLFMGSFDPLSTKMWNGITGSDDKPIINQMGGASSDTYSAADDAGIRTKSGRKMHDAAEIVASLFAAKGLKNSSAASKLSSSFDGGGFMSNLEKVNDKAGFLNNILKQGGQGGGSNDEGVDFGDVGVDRVGRFSQDTTPITSRVPRGFFGSVVNA